MGLRRSCKAKKKLKLTSDGGNSDNKKHKRGYGSAYRRAWRSLESGGRCFVGAFDKNIGLVAVKMFSHLIYYIKVSHNFSTFNVFWKVNSVINCIII